MFSVVAFDRIIATFKNREDAQQVCTLLQAMSSFPCIVQENEHHCDNYEWKHGKATEALKDLLTLLSGLKEP